MSHALKLVPNIIHSRISTKLEQEIGVQFGFRAGLGTKEALFSLQVPTNTMSEGCEIRFTCFIDFKKASD